jgi:hypothetical protein
MGHRRAGLTPFGRYLLVTRILEDGWSVSAGAESLGVSRPLLTSGCDAFVRKVWKASKGEAQLRTDVLTRCLSVRSTGSAEHGVD